jgi:hypothetical protein
MHTTISPSFFVVTVNIVKDSDFLFFIYTLEKKNSDMKTIKTFEAFSAKINESESFNLKYDEIMNILQGMETESLISLGDDLIGLSDDEVQDEDYDDENAPESEEWKETKNDLSRDEILHWICNKYERFGITEADLKQVIETY